MKNLWIRVALLAMVQIADGKAGYVLIEREADLERVGNNLVHFYRANAEFLNPMEACGFDPEKCKPYLNSIIQSKDVLTREILNAISDDLNQLLPAKAGSLE